MKKQSLLKNYVYQFLYQGLTLVIPFILSPYLTRTLQETALGTYTYVNSIAYYFVIASNLGIGVHGKRIIARHSSDLTKTRKLFWSLFCLHTVISLVALSAYFLFIGLFVREDKVIYLIQTLYVASALFDITWLFYGLENFKAVVIKNTAIKVGECILIFLFVKSPDDLWVYTLICTGGILAGQMVMIPQAVRILRPISFTISDMREHIRPMLVFSVALIATSMYTIFDKTLLGLLSTKENVAYYEFSNRLVNLPKVFTEISSTVMFPRACKLVAEGSVKEQQKYYKYSFLMTAFIGMGAIWGLAAIGESFAFLYYGPSFKVCGGIMIALSPVIYIVGAGKILRSQCMIPYGMDKQFNLCIVLNAIVNLILSTTLIPILGVYGAVIGTLSAEMFGFVYQMIMCRKYIAHQMVYKTLLPFALIGAAMYCIMKVVEHFPVQGVYSLILEILVGGMFYAAFSVAYVFFFQKDVKQLLRK